MGGVAKIILYPVVVAVRAVRPAADSLLDEFPLRCDFRPVPRAPATQRLSTTIASFAAAVKALRETYESLYHTTKEETC
jgi:hypothetical protein